MAKIGERIGTYEITRLLGSGGMAMVYAARHTSIGTEHALKILMPNYANNPRTVERFRQEARAQFRMRHPNIVQVTDFVDDGENLALVMDLVHGMTLAAAMQLRPGPWPVADVLAVMRPVLEAMTYAHREGLDGAAVVHRDLKPENVMLDLSGGRPWPGVAKVMDFGIAKVLGASNVATATNARMGTPGYMSPEQFKNAKDAGAPADVWALGVMLWQLLTGRLPVDPENNFALLDMYRGVTRVPLLAEVVPGVPVALSQAVAQALALDPGDRFADAAPLLRAVELGVANGAPAVLGWEKQTAEELRGRRELAVRARAVALPTGFPPVPAEMAPLPDLPLSQDASDAGNHQKSKVKWPILGPIALALFLFVLLSSGEKNAADPPRTEGAPAMDDAPSSQIPPPPPPPAAASIPSPATASAPLAPPASAAVSAAASAAVPEGMALIPTGSFKMGCVPGDARCDEDERPQHTVSLTAFYLDVHEVTVEKYRACVGKGKCTAASSDESECNWSRPNREQHPINCVDWAQSDAYCSWAGSRLPTEAEWEKAARGGLVDKAYPWSDQEPTCTPGQLNTAVWSSGVAGCGKGSTSPVGTGSGMNGYGLYDMSGNVWERVSDWYDNSFYESSPVNNPQGPSAGTVRGKRGGGFYNVSKRDLRTSNRYFVNPSEIHEGLGFRCARTLR